MIARFQRPRSSAAAPARSPRRAAFAFVRGALAWMALVLGAALVAPALARPEVPPAPAPDADGPARRPPGGPRGAWRDLTPEQRESIRQLSREQREALAARGGPRPGGPGGAGARLTPKERRELRAVIREEHERRNEIRRRP